MIGGEHYIGFPPAVDGSLGDMLAREAGTLAYFSTGRDALFALLSELPASRIYLPDLVCTSVYSSCRAADKEILFYPINSDFSHAPFAPEPGSCVLVMHYFGMPNHVLVDVARKHDALVVSDVTHMLFNREHLVRLAQNSDYMTASLRKSGPFPDGGFLSSRSRSVPEPTLPLREEFFSLRTAGLLSRGAAANQQFANDENFFLLRKAEGLIDQSLPGNYQCSYLSRQLLLTVSLQHAASAIKVNMAALATMLEGVCQTPNAGSDPSPYFPCVFRDPEQRDRVRSALSAHKYFCPVHWPTAAHPVSSALSDVCLSIPCDARYTEADMSALVAVIKNA